MAQIWSSSAEERPAGVPPGQSRPLGSFFGLGLLDIPPVAGSIWEAWCRDGHAAITAWTARAALAQLIADKAPRRVWLPAYSCPELASVARPSDLRFYPIDEGLSPKAGFLRQHLRSGDLVMATDYFGWPPSRDFQQLAAEMADVIWVEDRAQCLFTELPQWAPWLLYSPRKLVGVADGGILISCDGAGPEAPRADRADATLAIPELMRFEDADETENEAWYKQHRSREMRFSAEPRPLSRMTSVLLQRIPIKPLVAARQRNYRFLTERLAPFAAWLKPASDIAPFGLPIAVDDAASLTASLAAERLFCARHWPVLAADKSDFAWEHTLAQRLVTLPCDHRYEENALARLVAAVRRHAPSPR